MTNEHKLFCVTLYKPLLNVPATTETQLHFACHKLYSISILGTEPASLKHNKAHMAFLLAFCIYVIHRNTKSSG